MANPAAVSAKGPIAPVALPVPPTAGIPRPSGTPGGLTVLNWAGFKAAASYTFDDTNSSQTANYAALKATNVRMTFYLVTGTDQALDTTWMDMVRDGHELGNHSKSHRRGATADDVDQATDFLQERFGITVWTMASPFGDSTYPPLAPARFLANRGVVNGVMAPNDDTDPFNLYCYIPPAGAPASAFNAQIDFARAAGAWKTILVHGFSGGTDGAYQPVDLSEFIASVNYAKSFGDVWIDTVANVAAYWRAQKILSAVMPTTGNGISTWTWTVPAHFPPGVRLRVKVTGGTLTQATTVLPWNDHGYYELAFDAGTVTLSP